MYKYVKTLPYPVNISKKDLKMAKYIITALGGPAGELGAALRYFSQKFTMPDEKGMALLNDISVEELGHCEMVSEMFRLLTKDATKEELETAGLGSYYIEHGIAVFPENANGYPFNSIGICSSSDVYASLSEDMAAEEKARASYEALIDLASDPNLISALLFLRQREVVHFNRFKELYDYYKKQGI